MQNPQMVIDAYSKLGERLKNLHNDELTLWLIEARRENPWFSEENVRFSINYWSEILSELNLKEWLNSYSWTKNNKEKIVGVVAAGNIPLVGLHDSLCVIASGNILKIKPSSDDTFLITKVLNLLSSIEPYFKNKIHFVERMNDVEAIIATGSNNTARYFEYYFGKIPHIIRKNRTSIAVLTGTETVQDFNSLAKDVFTYFGLGCRNVTKLFLPENYDFIPLLDEWIKLTNLIQHHKYANNYEYHRGIFLMNQVPIYDNGIVILKKDSSLYSAVSVLNYEYYSSLKDLNELIEINASDLQCIVSKAPEIYNAIPLGTAQIPSLSTYPDNIDVINFLLQCS